MQRLEVGKLYRCSEYFLLLFPDKETAASVLNLGGGGTGLDAGGR